MPYYIDLPYHLSDASTELSMTFSIDVALGIVTLSPALLSDLGMTFSQQSVLGHCHSET